MLIPPAFLEGKGLKGVYEDLIGNEAFSAAPDECTDMYYPVVAKSVVKLETPVQQKSR